MKPKKSLAELTLLDRFLFTEVMDDPENLQTLLEIILGREIVLKFLPQTEKEQRRSPLLRNIRLDVWSQDVEGSVYDTEVQKTDTENIPRRSRLYQALIDSKLLEAGTVDFNELNDVYIIIIAPFDLFGRGRYLYTFRMMCEEDPKICLEDGSIRIFLNTHGRNKQEVTGELVELLRYMEHTDQESDREYTSERVKKLKERVQMLKASEEMGVRYMQAWEERELDRREGRAVGKAEAVLELLDDLGKISEAQRNIILEQKDLNVLKGWLKLAARARTVEEFECEAFPEGMRGEN
ncbi:Rpn family recombination-promoting nuclease/putative transposase [Ruminococcus sp. OA3]|uniref:Rpn family recombination-promoting nuclease/putative transposase n=1 Tax=Ruminococcus sp. OA3 TaxID=2914164 RepID=UPI001F057D4F|nr:Rpn family recombination-promoting nuclease/putative transposase [Ruminococcus sp. OA3]MCH1984040.1 Rpn family recombination-promoting nuclease/putative transposase [Ruminococcus sp. OA3]